MENQILDILEKRIKMVVDVIAKLREENQQLKEERSQLKEKIQEQDNNIKRLRQLCEELSLNENSSEILEKKMDQVKKRINAIITKLDELEPLA